MAGVLKEIPQRQEIIEVSRTDPYAEFQTPESDPYAEFAQAVKPARASATIPESTGWTRAREAAIGILEPFDLHNVPGLVQAVGGALHDALTGKGTAKAQELIKGAVTSPLEPVKEFATGISESDYDKAAHGAGGILSQTIPAIASAASLAKGALPKTPSPEAAEELYRSGLKARTTLPPAQVKQIVQTGLKHEIPISEEGLTKLQGLIDDLNQTIAERVKGSTAKVNPGAVAGRLQQTTETFGTQVNPEADLAAIQKSGKEFLGRHSVDVEIPAGTKEVPTGLFDESGNPITKTVPVTKTISKPKMMTAEEAQAEKIGTYRQLKSRAYGELKSAEVEAQKALARGLREELNKQIPELASLNEQDAKFLQLEPILEKAVNRAANANKGRMGPMIAGGATKVLTGSSFLGTVTGIMKAVLDDPEMASRLAIAINKAQQKNPAKFGGPNMKMAAAKIAALSGALSKASGRSNASE